MLFKVISRLFEVYGFTTRVMIHDNIQDTCQFLSRIPLNFVSYAPSLYFCVILLYYDICYITYLFNISGKHIFIAAIF